MTAPPTTPAAPPAVPSRAGFWNRELAHYPRTRTRYACLGIVVLATIVLYYQYYLSGAVAVHILSEYHMSFVYYVNISVISYIFGAVASFLTGVSDRYGRANIITIGLFLVGLLCLFGIPNAHSKVSFGVVFVLIGLVEGVILVATPALIRDFSPQLGRASAMGFWTLGPVLGSLVVTMEVSNTSDRTAWQDHYIAAGVVGIIVAIISAFFLRELAPALRDQLMVSSRDRVLLESRAKGIDVEATLKHPYRQMIKPDIVLSAFAISAFLLIYYSAVGFFPAYFQTIFGFSQSKANALGNWIWAFDAGALLLMGFLSDKLRVRKPFMIVGSLGAIVMTIMFLQRATHPHTSYSTFVWMLAVLAIFLGVAYAPWMASFTETIERRNPALTATGLAVWGMVIRIVVAVSVFVVPYIVTTVSTLVEKGPVVQQLAGGADPTLTPTQNAVVKAIAANPSIATKTQSLATQYQAQLATAAKIDPATQQALAANPTDVATQVKALSEISAVSAADVVTVEQVSTQHSAALQAAQAVDSATLAALLAKPTDAAAGKQAVTQIVTKTGVTAQQAIKSLTELASIPVAQLITVQTNGAKVAAAGAQLKALAVVPVADLGFLNRYGPSLQNKQVQTDLLYLQKNAPSVIKAAKDSPKQWQKYLWIAVGGQIVFIPLIFLMAGFWSPARARRKEEEHAAWLASELAKLDR